MLQVDVCPFASDALEDAMRLAQTKSLNSYTFSDCLSFLNYVWSDIYSQMCLIDSGYYSKTVQLTEKLTTLPKFVKNSIMVYAAQRPTDHIRIIFRQSGAADFVERNTYYISGNDLYCPEALRTKVWLEYIPQPAQIFFTHHNRDPKIYPDGHDIERKSLYNLYQLLGYIAQEVTPAPDANPHALGLYEQTSYGFKKTSDMTVVPDKQYYDYSGNPIIVDDKTVTQEQIANCSKWILRHRNLQANKLDNDITQDILPEIDEDTGKWNLKYISCDYPYIFCSYQNEITDEWRSGFFNKQMEWTDYNPFAFIGKDDNVEYITCHYNDKTGMGVIVRDWNDFDTKLLNIEQLPELVNSVIFVENTFEYKAKDNVTYKFTQGYWYNRFATDFNYELVPQVTEYPAYPDENDVVNLEGTLYRYVSNEWVTVDNIIEVAQEETNPVVKELGWTPDTRLVYPAPEVYRYLVARLAEKFASLNESNIMGVQTELADSYFAFQAFLKKDKSAWERIRNVNLPTIGDYL